MNIYRYEFEYKVYNSNGLEVDKGIETSKGYDEVRAENYLRTRLEEGCQSDEEVELKLIPSFVKYTDANKLIAEFMGCKEQTEPLLYHYSWDWLMPVVDKCFDTHFEHSDDLSFLLKTFKPLEEVYKAVVEFIKRTKKGA